MVDHCSNKQYNFVYIIYENAFGLLVRNILFTLVNFLLLSIGITDLLFTLLNQRPYMLPRYSRERKTLSLGSVVNWHIKERMLDSFMCLSLKFEVLSSSNINMIETSKILPNSLSESIGEFHIYLNLFPIWM